MFYCYCLDYFLVIIFYWLYSIRYHPYFKALNCKLDIFWIIVQYL